MNLIDGNPVQHGAQTILLSTYCPRETAIEPGQTLDTGVGILSSSAVIMHPLDFHEIGTRPGSPERIRAGIDYLLTQALGRLDRLEKHITT